MYLFFCRLADLCDTVHRSELIAIPSHLDAICIPFNFYPLGSLFTPEDNTSIIPTPSTHFRTAPLTLPPSSV